MSKIQLIFQDIKEMFRDAFSFLGERDHQRNLIIVSIIALAYVMPIVLANVPYLDDLPRLYKGATWIADSRFLNDFIFNTISFWGSRAHNFYPYSQLIGALLFAWTGYLLGIFLGIRNNTTRVVTSLVLLTFPFTFANIFFQWEPLYMGICMLVLLLPFLFYEKPVYYFSLSILSLLICAFTYQAFFPLYPISLAFLSIRLVTESREKEALRLLTRSIVAVLVFGILYLLLLKLATILLFLGKPLETETGLYVPRSSIYTGIALLENAIKRPLAFVRDVYFLSASPFYYIFLMGAISVTIVLTYKRLIQNSLKASSKGWITLYFLGIPFLAFSLLILLVVMGGLRSYLPVTFSLMGYLFLISWFYPKWANTFSFLLVLFGFFLISPFVQVQKSQWEFDQSLAKEMMANLKAEEIKEIIISGRAPDPALKRQWTLNNPIFSNRYLRSTFLLDDDWQAAPYLFKYLDLAPDSLQQVPEGRRQEILGNKQDYPILKKELHYWIRQKDGTVIMDFKKDQEGTFNPPTNTSLGEAFKRVFGFFK